MAIFPLLADPASYRACDTNLLTDHAARAYWLDLFASHFQVQLDAAATIGVLAAAREAASQAFLSQIDQLRRQPDLHGRLDILLLDELRQRVLDAHGIYDEFRLIKQRETEAALAELSSWLKRVDATAIEQRLETIAKGMLAGNLFDMGVTETARQYADAPVPFAEALARVPRRPWLIDDLDAANRAWLSKPPRKAVVFADNAGADVVLGQLPLVREMIRRGTEVVVAANQRASLNDVTCDELLALLDRVKVIDPLFGSDRLQPVHSGNAAPLIDLSSVSDELAQASVGAELVVLVGMGRGIESNFSAQFTCQSWTIAMIKDPQVARTVGGRMYDAVFRMGVPLQSSSGG